MKFIQYFFSESLEKEVFIYLTYYDYDEATHYLDYDWEIHDQYGTDIRDKLPIDEQDECESIVRKFARSL